MLSVELHHLSQMLNATNGNLTVSATAAMLSDEIRQAIYDYAVVQHQQHGKVLACKGARRIGRLV
jgi:meiotically up-regulated gene 157 (Mug157) protein